MTDDEKRKWADFAHTLRVVTASALARQELQLSPSLPPIFRKRYELTLLAAAGSTVTLPRGEVVVPGGGLTIAFEEGQGGIRVRLQLKGYAALRSNADRQARLVSSNGAIDYAFRFGRSGGAVCVLAGSPEVREGLSNLAVLVEVVDER
jgi:hypothetical protein